MSSVLSRRRGNSNGGVEQQRFKTTLLPLILIPILLALAANLRVHSQFFKNNTVDPTALWFESINATMKARYCSDIRGMKQIRLCYPQHLLNPLREPSCAKIVKWQDVQRCLVGQVTKPKEEEVDEGFQIHVIGERNSGTKFIMDELQRCFPKSAWVRAVHRDFVRSKHFFQNPTGQDFSKSIVVAIFRDPVEWVASMREKPYHSPNHIAGFDNVTGAAIPLPSWHDFVTKPWVTARSAQDLHIIRKLGKAGILETAKGNTCTQRFALYEVVPCIYDNNTTAAIPNDKLRGYYPIYELRRDRTGRPFNDILHLRREKIINFLLEVPTLFSLGGYVPVRYEDLLIFGTRALLEKVALTMGMEQLPPDCHPALPQPDRIQKRRQVPDELRTWIRINVDKATERMLGYVN